MNKRVVIYARCSTSHLDQNPEVQLSELRRYCAARDNWTVAEEIVDHGFKGSVADRPGLKRLLELARSRQIDAVVIVKLDRLFRSVKHIVGTLEEFSEIGIALISIKDQIDLTTASGRLMFHIISAFGQFERDLISERTKAGLEYARSIGRVLGRPETKDTQKILELRTKGLSYREISKQLGCSKGAVCRAVATAPKTKKLVGCKLQA